MKRNIIYSLALVMCTSIILGGCGDSSSSENISESSSKESVVETTEGTMEETTLETIESTTVNPFEGIEEVIEVSDLVQKTYIYQGGGIGGVVGFGTCCIDIHRDGTYGYTPGELSSQFYSRLWEINGSIVTFKELDFDDDWRPIVSKEIHCYMKDGNLVFIEGESQFFHTKTMKNGDLFYGSHDKYVEKYGSDFEGNYEALFGDYLEEETLETK